MCPFLLPEWSESSIPLLIPLYHALLFSLFCWVCVYLLSRSHSNTATGSPHRAGLYRLPVATEARGNGIRSAIIFDVNFIVNNHESSRERPSHWGNIYMLPVNPLMGLIEPHSKRDTSAGVTWSASSRAQILIGRQLGCLSPQKICFIGWILV